MFVSFAFKVTKMNRLDQGIPAPALYFCCAESEVMAKGKDKSKLYASFNIIRIGKQYRLVNYGESYEFEIMEILSDHDCLVRSLDTLETFNLADLTRYGKGEDFDFEEI